jgi:hypothetical protein
MKKLTTFLAVATATTTFALPVDMHGEFQADTYRIQDYRRIESTTDNSSNETQEVALAGGNKTNAAFQTYIFKLQPEIIVNDSTTLKAELTSGYGYGGTFGDSSLKRDEATTTNFTNALYTHSTTSTDLQLTQAYATLYADTATYKIGRHAIHWGLGAIHNSGEEAGSRHATIRDGITMDFKIGNFKISPYYSRIVTANLTKAGRAKETGVALLYKNIDRDLSFGILYAKSSTSNSTGLESDVQNANVNMANADVTITDLYFKKSIGMWTMEVEVPLLSGELGPVYTANNNTKYKAKAILFNNTFAYNAAHTFFLNVGQVSGDNGANTSFDAMYLHPNYQVANLLFRYNLSAIADNEQNIYDSYVTNATYLKASHKYDNGKWTWVNSIIWAKASEVAKAGESAFNHRTNKTFTAVADQKDDLGFEFDSNYTYKWNSSVDFGLNLGYLFTGDYFAYNNTADPNTVKNTYVLSAFANVKF